MLDFQVANCLGCVFEGEGLVHDGGDRPRWWRLGLAITEVVLAAGLIVAAMTEGGWYWWAGAIAAATLALINLSVYLLTKRERRKPPEP